jgi:tetratricopeptide (TPR) repeat protein
MEVQTMTGILSLVLLPFLLQQPSNDAVANQTGSTLADRARIEYWNGRFAESETLFLSVLRSLAAGDEAKRARILSELGDVYVNEDEMDKAEHAYIESFKTYKKLGDKTQTAHLLRNLGAVYSLEHRDQEALSILQRALKEANSITEPDPVVLGNTLNSLGVGYFRQGNLGKAEQYFNQAAKVLPNQDGLYDTADVLNDLGAVYHAKHEYTKAEDYLLRALKLTEKEVGSTHPDLTFPLSSLGVLYIDTRQYSKAEEQYLRALKIVEDNPVFETRTARLLQGLSRAYAGGGRIVEAEAALFRAATLARRHLTQHSDMAGIVNAYASALTKGGRNKEADELRSEARRAQVSTDMVIKARSAFP